MRGSALLLLSTVFLSTVAIVAHADPTPEEQALKAALSGRHGEAEGVLERTGDADLRWLAGRYAVEAGDLGAARRLLNGADEANAWGRVALLERGGEVGSAAKQALALMDAALTGDNRDALARMLLGWADERARAQEGDSAQFLWAGLSLSPSPATRRLLEDGLLAISALAARADLTALAQGRLDEEPGNLGARLRLATSAATRYPSWTLENLKAVVADGTRLQAFEAASAATTLAVPDPLILDVLAKLQGRFPEDAGAAALRLGFAVTLAARDEVAGTAALAALVDDPRVGADALEAEANATSDATASRALWMTLAKREGASSRGERARAQALRALVSAVAATPNGEAQREAATRALAQPDGKDNVSLLYYALPSGSARLEALWGQAERFPKGPAWCGELASDLLAAGADDAEATRWTRVCTPDQSIDAKALSDQLRGEPNVTLRPLAGRADAWVVATEVLHVQQHRVDPEALFLATQGNPLETRLDAFLVAPDAQWDLALQADTASVVSIRPRSGGPLSAITARAGDRRATALVLGQPLTVQLVRKGKDIAVGVLRDERPVGGADLWLQDDEGKIVRGRTGRDGVLLAETATGSLRVMARKGEGLGFATASPTAEGEEAPTPTFALVPWDRAAPSNGGTIDVEVFGTLPAGDADGAYTLISKTSAEEVERVPLTLSGGAAHARIWAYGAGTLVLQDAKGTALVEQNLASPVGGSGPFVIGWSDLSPRPGGELKATVLPLGALPPGGLDTSVEYLSAWHNEDRALLMGPEGTGLTVSLAAALPDARLSLRVGTPLVEGGTDYALSAVYTAAPVAPEAVVLPGWVDIGAPITGLVPADTWVRARLGKRQIWARGDQPLRLPEAGRWAICAWREVCGPETAVYAGEPRGDAKGRWSGAATLAAVVGTGLQSAHILRSGDPLPSADLRGLTSAWLSLVETEEAPEADIPLLAAPTPAIGVEGTLTRSGTSTLQIGEELPAQSQIWAFLRDATDLGGVASAAEVAALRSVAWATTSKLWRADDVSSVTIAEALLEEEEQRAEGGPLQRLEFSGFGAKEHGGGLGGGGSAEGMGGMGTHGRGSGGSGSGGRGAGGARSSHPLGWDPKAIAVATERRPGAWTVEVPGWVMAADLEVVARLPDGRWTSRVVRLPVGGPPPVAIPVPAPAPVAETWDGKPASLLPLALSLPADGRAAALAALSRAGVVAASAPMRAAFTNYKLETGGVLGLHLLGLSLKDAGRKPDRNVPDLHKFRRAEGALELAPQDAGWSISMAQRLLMEPELEEIVRAQAGLALWVAGDKGAEAALAGEGPTLAAARAWVSGKADARYAGAWWAIAREEGANARIRALALGALSMLPDASVPSAPRAAAPAPLALHVEPALVSLHGRSFPRGRFGSARGPEDLPMEGTTLPVGRQTTLWATLPERGVPTRFHCPDGGGVQAKQAWVDLPPLQGTRAVRCDLVAEVEGRVRLEATWYAPDGTALASGTAPLTVVPAVDSAPGDPMSPRERLGFGAALAEQGNPTGMEMLRSLLATENLPYDAIRQADLARVHGAAALGDPAGVVAAVDTYREHQPEGALDLESAGAFAHAAAATGQGARAIRAAQTILDARFKEELGAVSTVRSAGLELTALELLRTLLRRYPEVPTVIAARYLAPSMLLERAEGDGDRLGYTRASLRHTAAGELAGFLLLHGDAPQAPEAAALLMNTLDRLIDPGRSAALAAPLTRAYRSSEQGWLLALADARARIASGSPRAALDALEGVEAPEAGRGDLDLARGQALEALGRVDEAKKAYAESDRAEAAVRGAWLVRTTFSLPPIVVLRPGDPSVLPAQMRPGIHGTLISTRVALEDALLSQNGPPDLEAFAVSGLGAPTPRPFTVNTAGEIPLPSLANGAYLLELQAGDVHARAVLIRTDASLQVVDSGAQTTFTHLSDVQGRPLAGANVWLFQRGQVTRARTDAGGATWTPGNADTALARIGDRYAWWQATPAAVSAMELSNEGGVPPSDGGLLNTAASGYDDLFKQEQRQEVKASAL